MTRAKGRRDFLSKEWVVGTAFRVDRTYLGGQFAFGEGVTLVWTCQQGFADMVESLTFCGNIAGGGGYSSSATLKGVFSRSVG
jgi:hypothetical protein